ncbi:MAG: nucleoside recognition domain-containing protein [Burkholderiaceae bacterium]|nr:nucleoside recognition domain-containing protein [Burkholderiaceae bacterium]
MNAIFLAIVLVAFGTAAWHELFSIAADGAPSPMQALSSATIASAGDAVTLAIGLVGAMALFLGLMKVAEAGGLLTIVARLIRPLMTRLFRDVPAEHPAMGAMVLNLSANALGLGNAATPFGIRAMQELDKLNPRPGTATDAMALFLAINTSSVTLLPTAVIALRASAGSSDPAGILPTTLFASICGTVAAVVTAFALARFFPVDASTGARGNGARSAVPQSRSAWPASAPPVDAGVDVATTQADASFADRSASAYPLWASVLALVALAALVPLTVIWGRTISPWIVPALVAGFLCFGLLRGVRVYESFIEGAKDGFDVAVRIIPYLVAILVAIGMLRASGALDAIVGAIGGFTTRFGLPAEALPMALLRPLSGSGAYGIMASIIGDPAIGPDSYVGYLVSTLQGSSETTFYVLAVYFGAVQVRRVRHTLAAALVADFVAVVAAVAACRYLFG